MKELTDAICGRDDRAEFVGVLLRLVTRGGGIDRLKIAMRNLEWKMDYEDLLRRLDSLGINVHERDV